jgi:hypothetical protein
MILYTVDEARAAAVASARRRSPPPDADLDPARPGNTRPSALTRAAGAPSSKRRSWRI